MLQVPFDFIDFSKDFLEGKIDLEENSDKDEVWHNMWDLIFFVMLGQSLLIVTFPQVQ